MTHILELQITSNDPDVIEYYKKSSEKDSKNSGFDLIFPENLSLKMPNSEYDNPNYSQSYLINLKVKCQLACKDGCDGKHGYFLMSRSSIYKECIRQSNSVGLIDYEYRGEIQVPVDILQVEYKVVKNKRLFQLVMPNATPFKVKIVDDLTKTERGEGGFGSTNN